MKKTLSPLLVLPLLSLAAITARAQM